jgi:hypothetical protein
VVLGIGLILDEFAGKVKRSEQVIALTRSKANLKGRNNG